MPVGSARHTKSQELNAHAKNVQRIVYPIYGNLNASVIFFTFHNIREILKKSLSMPIFSELNT